MPQERKLGVAVQLDGSDASDKTFVTITRERGQVQQKVVFTWCSSALSATNFVPVLNKIARKNYLLSGYWY